MKQQVQQAGTVCYTGEHARRDGVHTVRDFKRRMRRICGPAGDCPRTEDPVAWADWAGASYTPNDPDGWACRYHVHSHAFLQRLVGMMVQHGSVTVRKAGSRFVIQAESGEAVQLPAASVRTVADMYAASERSWRAHMARVRRSTHARL